MLIAQSVISNVLIITSVTTCYLSCIMETNCTSPSLLGSGQVKQGCPLERQNVGLTPNCSLMNTPDGVLRASPTHHPPQYVPACHQGGVEGSREVHPLRLVAEPAKAWPQGRHTCHATWRVSDLSERDQGPLPWSIFTKKITWLTTLQAQMEGRGYPGHPVLPEEPLAQAGGHCHAGGGPMRGCCNYPQPIHQPESWSRSWRREEPHNEALWEAREAHQQVLGGHLNAGTEYWKTELGSRECPILMPL